MMKDGKIQRVAIMPVADVKEIEHVEAKAATLPPPKAEQDDDFSEYLNTSRYGAEAVGKL
jgi:hypothetical protein